MSLDAAWPYDFGHFGFGVGCAVMGFNAELEGACILITTLTGQHRAFCRHAEKEPRKSTRMHIYIYTYNLCFYITYIYTDLHMEFHACLFMYASCCGHYSATDACNPETPICVPYLIKKYTLSYSRISIMI